MSSHGYESGRLNLPFVGICTFAKGDYVADWDAIDADVAVLGAPYDFGCQWRSGARMGPRAIREASTLFSFGHGGAYDFEDDVTYLPASETKIVDIGDADIIHTDTENSHANDDFFEVLQSYSSEFAPDTHGRDIAVYQYTSGTTRELPEAVRHSHASLVTLMLATLYGTGQRPGDKFFVPSSPAWGHGLWHGMIAPLSLGITSVASTICTTT